MFTLARVLPLPPFTLERTSFRMPPRLCGDLQRGRNCPFTNGNFTPNESSIADMTSETMSSNSSLTSMPSVADNPFVTSILIRNSSEGHIITYGFRDDGNTDDIVASWALAINRCRESLNEFDFEKLQSFPTPERLLSDIKERGVERPALLNIRRPIRTMKSSLAFFVVIMSPRNVNSSIFWGLVYLLADLSEEQRDMNNRWAATIDMLGRVTRSLDGCKRTHENTRFDEDMKLTLNDAFIDLITFWAETVSFMRSNPYTVDGNDVQSKFERVSKKVDDSFKYLKFCATTREKNQQQASLVTSAVSLRSLLPDNLASPCGGAPLYNDDDFLGRQSELEDMDAILRPEIDKRNKFFTIWGLGGIGKSKLALAYATRYRHHFDVILWIKAQTIISISQSFTDIAIELRLQGANQSSNVDQNRQLVLDFLKRNSGNWLVVWDNVETQASIRQYLSPNSTSASMLVTTRYPEEASYFRSRGPILNLQKFSLDESKQLFSHMLGRENYSEETQEMKATEVLLQKMDGLAIGICTMAIRIVSKDQSIQNFLKRYGKGMSNSVPGELADYDLTLESMWNESFGILEQEQKKGPSDCFSLLGVLSFCSPGVIPRNLFVRDMPETLHDIPSFCQDFDEYEEAMASLRKNGLITSDRDFKAVTIHRLVQTAFRKFLGHDSAQTFFGLAVRLVHQAFPKQVQGRPLHLRWDDCRAFIQHGTWLADTYAESLLSGQKLLASQEFSELLSNCIWYLVEIGEHSEVQRISNIALKAVSYDTYHYGHLHNSLLAINWFQNDLKNAFIHSEVVLSALKAHRDETSEEYVGILSNRANLLASNGNDEEALSLLLRVEETRRRLKHPENIALAFVNLGIGRLRCRLGELEDAEIRFNNARDIVNREHGERGQYMQHVCYELGNLELMRGRLTEAEMHYNVGQSVQEDENQQHVFISSFLYKRASIRMELGDLDTAGELLNKAATQAVHQGSEGEEARVLRKIAELRLLEGHSKDSPEVANLKTRARYLKSSVEEKLGIIQAQGSSEKDQYDKLLCVIYR